MTLEEIIEQFNIGALNVPGAQQMILQRIVKPIRIVKNLKEYECIIWAVDDDDVHYKILKVNTTVTSDIDIHKAELETLKGLFLTISSTTLLKQLTHGEFRGYNTD